MRRTLLSLLALSVALPVPRGVEAQVPVSLNVYGGIASPAGDFGDRYAAERTGYGFDLTLHFNNHVGIWAGRSWNDFRCEVECPSGGEAYSTQTSAGVTLRFLDAGRFRPWVRGGVVRGSFTQTGERVNAGTYVAVAFETDNGVGLDLSVGVDVPVWSSISVAPAVRYRRFTAEYQRSGYGQADFEVGLTSFELGLRVGPFG